ncbi:hypothetical protein ACQJBY_010107 [Aegilops geniculata]
MPHLAPSSPAVATLAAPWPFLAASAPLPSLRVPPAPGRGRLRPATPRLAPSPSDRVGRSAPRPRSRARPHRRTCAFCAAPQTTASALRSAPAPGRQAARPPDHGRSRPCRAPALSRGPLASCPWRSQNTLTPTRAGAGSRRGFTAAPWPPSTAAPGLEHRPAGRRRHNRRRRNRGAAVSNPCGC